MNYVIADSKAVVLVIVVLFCFFNRHTVTLVLVEGRIEYSIPMFLPVLA